MRILFDGKVKDATSIVNTNSNIDYSATNIAHPFLARRLQAFGNSSVVTITLDNTYDINCFFYALHNLNALTAVFKNSGGSTIGTVVVSTINDVGVEYFTTISAVKTIEVTISSASGDVYLGGFDAGLYYQMPDFLNAFPIAEEENSLSRISLGGQISFEPITALKIYEFNFSELLKEDVENVLNNYNISGKRPIYTDITEGDRTYFEPVYGQITEPPNALKSNRRFTNKILIQEAR